VVSQALPPYTPPGGSGPVSGTAVTAYNTLGQVTSQTDPLGNVTRYAYDQLGRRTSQTDPNNGVTSTSYDADGEALSQTGPTGAQATSTYDYLGRQVTATEVERYPSAASYTTITSYAPTAADLSGTWKSLVTSPAGVATSYGYDAAGEATQVTDGAGNTSRFSFDALGRQTATVNPDGTSSTVTYDAAGNQLGTASLDAAGQTLAGFNIAHYLGMAHVPGAGELAVFCGAVGGAGIGFLGGHAGTSPRPKYDRQERLTLIASKGRSPISRKAPRRYRTSGNPAAGTSARARMC